MADEPNMPPIDRSNEFDLLTPEEWDVYDALSVAWNRFVALPVLFVGDRPEFANHINTLKTLVMSRAVAREMAKRGWSGYGE
jgi:hypothetical protein